MAHEIELRNGRHSFFEVGVQRTAWHQLGELLPGAPSLEDAVRLIRADYTVEKRPVRFSSRDENGQATVSVSKLAFLNVRTDTGAELGAVGPLYQPVQNIDAFRATIGPLLDSGVLTLETGAVLKDGGKAFLLGRLKFDHFGPIAAEVFEAEGILPYVGISTDHSGGRGNLLALTMIRWVCANTLGMDEVSAREAEQSGKASDRLVTIPHLGDAHGKHVVAAEKLIGNLVAKAETIAKSYKLLREAKLDRWLFNALALIPVIGVHPTQRKEFNPEAKLADSVVDRYEQRVKGLTTLWESGKGHVGDHSAWEAYNGVVEGIDHDENLFPSRSGVFRLGALLNGDLRQKKDRALNRLTSYAMGDLEATLPALRKEGRLVLAK